MKFSEAEQRALAHPTWADAYLGALAEWLLFGPTTAIAVVFTHLATGGDPLYSIIVIITAYLYALVAGLFATAVCVFLAMGLAYLLRPARRRLTHLAAYFALALVTATLFVAAVFPALGFASDPELAWPVILAAALCVPAGWAISLRYAVNRDANAGLALLSE